MTKNNFLFFVDIKLVLYCGDKITEFQAFRKNIA